MSLYRHRALLTGLFVLLLSLATACSTGAGGSSTGNGNNNGDVNGSGTPPPTSEPDKTESPKTDFPKQPVRLVITHSAGGATDSAMRTITPFLEEELGQPVVIENMVGAGGNVAAAHVYQQKPDGYTLLASQFPSLAISQIALKGDFDVVEMTAVYQVMGGQAQSLLVKGDSPWRTFEDVVEASKTKRLTLAGPGLASNGYLCYVLHNAAGIQADYIPFDSGPEAITAVAGGQTDLACADTVSLPELLANNQVHAVSVASAERNHNAPDAPTLRELGFDDSYFDVVTGVIGPPGIPDEILKVLSDAFDRAASNPKFLETAEKSRFTPVPLKPDKFKESINQGFTLADKYKDLLLSP